MIEIVVLIVGVVILASVFQEGRRETASPEEHSSNPTLLDSLSNAASKVERHSELAKAEAEFRRDYLKWYEMFKISVSNALKSAEYYYELEVKLNANPELRKKYNVIMESWSVETSTALVGSTVEGGSESNKDYEKNIDSEGVPVVESDWLNNGRLPKPSMSSDTEIARLQMGLYENCLKEHFAFICWVRATLYQNPSLKIEFNKVMTCKGLAPILLEHFPDTSAPKPSPKVISKTAIRSAAGGAQLPSDGHVKKSVVKKERTKNNALEAKLLAASLQPDSIDFGDGHVSKVSEEKIEIRALAQDLEIPHLVHFTRCDNLPSILRYGLSSVAICEAEGISGIRNDRVRLDGQPDGISLSITFPNYRMFYKYRQLQPSEDWAVILLSPKILWEKECSFYKYNAADSRMRHKVKSSLKTAEALQEMFETSENAREPWLRRYDPSDPQAEVMVYNTIEARFIETVAFETKAVADKWARVLGGIDRIYAGDGKGLFASRMQVRLN